MSKPSLYKAIDDVSKTTVFAKDGLQAYRAIRNYIRDTYKDTPILMCQALEDARVSIANNTLREHEKRKLDAEGVVFRHKT